MEMILNAILTVAFSAMAISGSVMFISIAIEDRKRTQYEKERKEYEQKRYEELSK